MVPIVMTSHLSLVKYYAAIKPENKLEAWEISGLYLLSKGRVAFLIFFFSVWLSSFLFIGKEVLLLMQALNTLSTPEEKLAALCKKYADLVSNL